MKKNWKMVAGLVLALLVVVFAVMNMEEATVNFGFMQVKQPLIILILFSTLLGALIIALFSSASLFSKNRQIKALQKELADLEAKQAKKVDAKVEQIKDSYEQIIEEKEETIKALEQAEGKQV